VIIFGGVRPLWHIIWTLTYVLPLATTKFYYFR